MSHLPTSSSSSLSIDSDSPLYSPGAPSTATDPACNDAQDCLFELSNSLDSDLLEETEASEESSLSEEKRERPYRKRLPFNRRRG
mmetsp:Transcript_11434/g.17226  ORF Transcript_11434/g.17226 Transcript_11434/m.17226 type:complete len:85 (+) Transcript_11434:54-308(+)